jgi:hypothetical protein
MRSKTYHIIRAPLSCVVLNKPYCNQESAHSETCLSIRVFELYTKRPRSLYLPTGRNLPTALPTSRISRLSGTDRNERGEVFDLRVSCIEIGYYTARRFFDSMCSYGWPSCYRILLE